MEERVKTSFIPKASLQVEHSDKKNANPVALFNIVAIIILVMTIVGALGVFLFERYTIQSISSKKESLQKSRGAFEPATIKELSRLDARIEAGKTLLKAHVALSKLYDELEARTLSTVRFKDLEYSVVTGGKVSLTMTGEAKSFNAVALQSDAFSKSDIITDPIFSNVNINKDGTIDFNFTAIIDVNRMRYTGTAQAPSPTETQVPSL